MSIMFLIALFVIVIWIVYAFCHQVFTNTEIQYDERQDMIRYKGYQYAAYTGIIMSTITGLIYSFAKNLAVDAGLMMIVTAFVSELVYIVYCIMQGIYFGISGKWQNWFWTMLVIGSGNVLIGVKRIQDYGLLQNGRLTLQNNGNFLIGIIFLVMPVTVLIAQLVNKKKDT